MGSLPIVFTDAYGTHLEVDRRRDRGLPASVGVLLRTSGGGYFILAADVDLMAAISEAAGKPAPIILERPALAGTHTQCGFARIGPDPRDRTRLEVSGLTGSLTPAMARELARHIAARADEIDAAEPDPAEVTALADVIRETSGSTGNLDIARAVLAAGWRPPERKGGER